MDQKAVLLELLTRAIQFDARFEGVATADDTISGQPEHVFYFDPATGKRYHVTLTVREGKR